MEVYGSEFDLLKFWNEEKDGDMMKIENYEEPEIEEMELTGKIDLDGIYADDYELED